MANRNLQPLHSSNQTPDDKAWTSRVGGASV